MYRVTITALALATIAALPTAAELPGREAGRMEGMPGISAIRFFPEPAPLCTDTDGDGLCDDEEGRYDTSPTDRDTDKDGLTDGEEVKIYGTDPRNPDSDADALVDGDEIHGVRIPGVALPFRSSPIDPDSDKDGLGDGEEVRTQRSDPRSIDSDGDAVTDGDEVRRHFTGADSADTDGDGLGDGIELTQAKTDPLNPDTDGDKIVDGIDNCPAVYALTPNGCPPGVAPIVYRRAVPPALNVPVTSQPSAVPSGSAPGPLDSVNIYFQVNSSDFDFSRPETARNLQTLLDYMRGCEEVRVLIEGHASTEGNKRRNEILSQQRAQRTRAWLGDNDIPAEKVLGAVGYGSSIPKISESRPDDRRENRRVTVMVKRPCSTFSGITLNRQTATGTDSAQR